MKKLLVALGALALTAGMAPSAWALGISADLPMQYAFTDDDAPDEVDGVNGYKVGLHELIFVLGAGYEDYTVDFTTDSPGGDIEGTLDNTFVDVLVDLPLPLVNVALGYGMGTGRLEIDQAGAPEFKDADLSQYFVSVGPQIGMFDIHVGYHEISGEAECDTNCFGGDADADLASNMTSVGARIGF